MNTSSYTHVLRISRFALLLPLLWLAIISHAQTTNVWVDHFESPTVWNNWSVDNGVWEIGAPLTGPAINSAGFRTHEGTNCAATVLGGNYPASTSSRLIRTLPFVVPSASQNPRLEFWHWYAFSGGSYGVVQVKSGTNPWTDLSPRYYASSGGVWTRPVVDLKAYAGKAVQIAFQIAADGNAADGWDVDEVRVIKGPYQTITNNVAESFEMGFGDWYADAGTWEVGVPTSGPDAAHGGNNCLGTVLGGSYTEDRSSRFVSQPFVVPADQARLRFWQWFSIGAHDWTQVQIKVGTNAWQGLSGQYTSTTSGYWTRAWLDLSAYTGQTVQLGFYFESHSAYNQYGSYVSSVSSGWYVDDVVIETGTPVPASFPEGFEGGWSEWRVDYIGGEATDFGIWQIGQPTSGPESAQSGTNCAATILSGNYPEDRSGRLFSPPFVVPVDQPRLRFWQWFSIGAHDWTQVQIKVGTNAWQGLSGQYTATTSGYWTRAWLDLSAYTGQTVQLGFYFESHSAYNQYGSYVSSVSSGWYVDDVVIETGHRFQRVFLRGLRAGGVNGESITSAGRRLTSGSGRLGNRRAGRERHNQEPTARLRSCQEITRKTVAVGCSARRLWCPRLASTQPCGSGTGLASGPTIFARFKSKHLHQHGTPWRNIQALALLGANLLLI